MSDGGGGRAPSTLAIVGIVLYLIGCAVLWYFIHDRAPGL